MKSAFISDCEGPISKNDNAFELTSTFVPNGDKLFTVISKYDDVLADVVRKPEYHAGDTLKLIMPFLKAYGVTDAQIEQFSARTLVLIANSKQTLKHVRTVADAFIVSTSYEHYIRALCTELDFPFENTYCTRLTLDAFSLPENEKSKIMDFASEISQMPLVNIPLLAKSIADFSKEDQAAVARLDEIFWDEMVGGCCGELFSEVKPIGGEQKAEAIRDIAAKLGLSLSDVMYVGDSITDVEAFKLVRNGGGLTLSFNGNKYAVENAEIAVLSDHNLITAAVADVFCRLGKTEALKLAREFGQEPAKYDLVNRNLHTRFLGMSPQAKIKIQIVTKENMDSIAGESSEFRKKVRGESVGRLG